MENNSKQTTSLLIASRWHQAVNATRSFRPFFYGGHKQTLVGHFLPGPVYKPTLAKATRPIEVKLNDGDRLVGLLFSGERDDVEREVKTPQKSKGLLHVFHGLAGSIESGYMPRAALAARSVGWDVALWNHRGCGSGRTLAFETYHSGRSDDLGRAVSWGRTHYPNLRQGVLGYSLSGNAAILLAAAMVPSVQDTPLSSTQLAALQMDLPDFTIAVNPPLDLSKAAARLSRESSRLYGQRFILDLLDGLDDRIQMEPTTETQSLQQRLASAARKSLRAWSTVIDFDSVYTGRAAGFLDHLDYYKRCSSGLYLQSVRRPTMVLTAEDDPITHGLRDLQTTLEIDNPLLIRDQHQHGGHMGFVDRTTLLHSMPPLKALKNRTQEGSTGRRWLEDQIILYLNCVNASLQDAV